MVQKRKLTFVILAIFSAFIFADIKIYFAPKGGFSQKNNQRKIVLKNGETLTPTLNNALLALIKDTPEGGTIKIAMYAFGYRPIQEALIDAAKNRKIKIKLIMDAIAAWTQEIRTEFKTRILEEHKLAKKEGRVFDFQLKEILPRFMVDRGRIKKLRDGEMIYGTMHEKFGIFFDKGCRIPLHGFCGSANISWSAGQVFAENRVIFRNEAGMGRQLAEEFARLWNEFGEPVTENCQSEIFIPTTTNLGQVQIISNSKPLNEEEFQRIDTALMHLMGQVNPKNGTLDVAMFSFTHTGLADKLLRMAERYPRIKVRILLDQTQLEADEGHQGVLGPYMEKVAAFKGLKNFFVRYKWRSNTYAWDPESQSCQLIHWRNLLLHHKCLIVNRYRMGLGSYNWSSSAEFRNFENVMMFNGDIKEHQDIINQFMLEFDVMWNALKTDKKIIAKLPNPQVVTGTQGRKLKKMIFKAFEDPTCKKIMGIIDTNPNGCSEKILMSLTGTKKEVLGKKLDTLIKATLIFEKIQNGQKVYFSAD